MKRLSPSKARFRRKQWKRIAAITARWARDCFATYHYDYDRRFGDAWVRWSRSAEGVAETLAEK